jgi:hypothetical protein
MNILSKSSHPKQEAVFCDILLAGEIKMEKAKKHSSDTE